MCKTHITCYGWMVSKEYMSRYVILFSGCTMFWLITNLIQPIAFGRRWFYFKCYSFLHLNFSLSQYWWLYRHFVAACIETTESNIINGNKWDGFRKPVYVYHKSLASGKCKFQFSCHEIVDAETVLSIFFKIHMNLTCIFLSSQQTNIIIQKMKLFFVLFDIIFHNVFVNSLGYCLILFDTNVMATQIENIQHQPASDRLK